MTQAIFTGYDLLIGVTIASGFTAAALTFLFEWYHHAKRVEEWKERQEHWKARKNQLMQMDKEEGWL